MFSVLALAANDSSLSVARSAFELCERVCTEHFPLLLEHQAEGAACLATFLAQTSHDALAVHAATRLVDYSRSLHAAGVSEPAAKGDDGTTNSAAGPPVAAPPCVSASPSFTPTTEKVWFPILGALASGVVDARTAVRAASLQSLDTILAEELAADGALHGELGRQAYQQFVLRTFDERLPPDLEGAGEVMPAISAEHAEWLGNTGLSALAAAERCFCRSWSLLGSDLLDLLVALLARCLQQRHTPSLAHVAAEALLHLVKETGASFSQDTWASVCAELKSCFDGPEAYMRPAPPPQLADAAAIGESPLAREVSQRVEKEAPEGSGPHELQVLLLSTVYQLLQINHPLMKVCASGHAEPATPNPRRDSCHLLAPCVYISS